MTSPIAPTGLVPTFHDGYLMSITLGGRAVVLGLTNSAGHDFELKLSELEALKADNFLGNTIVRHLEIDCATPPCWIDLEDRLSQLLPPYHKDVAPKLHVAHAERHVSNLARIARAGPALVSIESTMGCDLIALCDRYELVQHKTP